jgi:RNA polymerase sigma-70 factor (ECF subfamily)
MRDPKALNDTELVRSAQQGDMNAFEELVYRHDKEVFAIAARYVNRAEDAKDIYQEVFLQVYRGLSKFRFQSEFSTWLYRITTNVCLTHQDRRKKTFPCCTTMILTETLPTRARCLHLTTTGTALTSKR